jgi:hypothetical protein
LPKFKLTPAWYDKNKYFLLLSSYYEVSKCPYFDEYLGEFNSHYFNHKRYRRVIGFITKKKKEICERRKT